MSDDGLSHDRRPEGAGSASSTADRKGGAPGKRTLVETVFRKAKPGAAVQRKEDPEARPPAAGPVDAQIGWSGSVDQLEQVGGGAPGDESEPPAPAGGAKQEAAGGAPDAAAPDGGARDSDGGEEADDADGVSAAPAAPASAPVQAKPVQRKAVQRKEAPAQEAAAAPVDAEKRKELLDKKALKLVRKVRRGKLLPAGALASFFDYDRKLNGGRLSIEAIPISAMLLGEVTHAYLEYLDKMKAAGGEAKQQQAADEVKQQAAGEAKGAGETKGGKPPVTFKRNFEDADVNTFKQQVYERETQLSLKRGKKYFAGLKPDEMDVVESGKKMRKDAAAQCKSLLAAARIALATARSGGNELATRTEAIGCASGYRDPEADLSAWEKTFSKHYHKENVQAALEKLEGGKHGEAAVDWFAHYLSGKKAVAGFSNHTSGIAMDFSTNAEIDGKMRSLGPNTDQRALWRKTWFWSWLVETAASFGFKPLSTEEWHWDYKP